VTAITETSAEVGGALGIALLGVAGTAVYRNRIAGTLPPGVPQHAAGAARDTLGGAVAAAARLPDQAGYELAGTARQAFGYGLHVAFAICAVLTLAAAVAAATLLRHLRAAEPEFQPEPGQVRPGS
jgi:DHA2 family multidrug resistance protein-like MFS transporter